MKQLKSFSILISFFALIATLEVNAQTKADNNTLTWSTGTGSYTGQTYTNSTSDANCVKVSGGSLTLTNCTFTKTGDTSDSDGSSFYGTNSALLGTGGTFNISGGTITTNAKGANGIVCYGGTVNVSNMTINCTANLSRGIHTTGGGTLVAKHLTITTAGNNSSVIALDKGGGTETVTGGTYTCTGSDCAVLYSTGNLTVDSITGSSAKGEIGVIEGSNYININNSDITSGAGSSSRAMMILQSGSGDAGTGKHGYINVFRGKLTSTGTETPFIEIVSNCTGTLTLDSVETSIASGILMKVDYNTRWSTSGATGQLILSGSGTTYTGSILVDSYSAAEVTVNKGVIWKGAYDTTNSGKSTTLTNTGTWTLTADSYVDKIVNNGVINKNGHTLTYSSLTGNAPIDNATAIEKIENMNLWSADGAIHIYTPAAARTYIVNMMGQVVRTMNVSSGETTISGLPAGLYIVSAGNTTKKVIVK